MFLCDLAFIERGVLGEREWIRFDVAICRLFGGRVQDDQQDGLWEPEDPQFGAVGRRGGPDRELTRVRHDVRCIPDGE